MLRKILSKAFGIGITVVQCGCIAHCTFEHVADFVVVSIYIVYVNVMVPVFSRLTF